MGWRPGHRRLTRAHMTSADLSETDADIVSASLADPARFERLYDRHAHDIHRFAARRLGVVAAEDITAEAFLIAFRTRSRYDPGRPNAVRGCTA